MSGLTVAGLFAGIGGIELGLQRAGHESILLSEIDSDASRVLARRFPEADLHKDVREVQELPQVDLLAAGFPCTDISQAGRKVGIDGAQSGLVSNIFRLLDSSSKKPEYLLIENVSYLLRLQKGRGLKMVLDAIEDRGYRWAYRVVDSRAFGLAQRRQRVIILAARERDPAPILFNDNEISGFAEYDKIGRIYNDSLYGFYWTEGKRGLGWTRNAVPTIKGGSGLGIPSAPAVWDPQNGAFGTPMIGDGEALQGLPRGWTQGESSDSPVKEGVRWKQVGNAVSVPMSEWVGRKLAEDDSTPIFDAMGEVSDGGKWPNAATRIGGSIVEINASTSPRGDMYDLRSSLTEPLKPLSERASKGFLSRARLGNLKFPNGFLSSLEDYIARI